MQAQERGELVQMQDEASYALGGMGQSCSTDTQRDSAVTITEMMSTVEKLEESDSCFCLQILLLTSQR